MAELRSGWHHGMFGYWRANGTFMPIIAGAAPDDDGDDSGGTDDEEDDESDDEEEDSGGGDIKDPLAKLKAESEKNERLSRKLRKAEADAADSAKKLKDAEDAKKSDQEKLAERADAAEKLVADLEKQIDISTKRLALLDNDDLASLSPGRRKLVLKLIDIDDLEIDDDGASNADELVEDVKKAAPELFESTDSEGDDEESDEEDRKRKQRTASPPKKRKKSGEVDRASLEQRMPHLAKHR